MMKKLTTIICLLSAMLVCDAAIILPDSMLTLRKAYTTTSSDTSLAIIQAIRQRQLAPVWQINLAEADYRYATMDYTRALQLYQRVYRSGEARGDDDYYLPLLARLMQTSDILYNDEDLVTYITELKDRAKRKKNDAYMAMADFIIGKRKHYHRHKAEGYELCANAVERIKASDYFRKYNELCADYADMLLMYMGDGRYNDAIRMSLLQQEAVLRIKGISANNKETQRCVYAMRASLMAKAGRQELADQAYEAWKKQPGGNAIVDKPILDYLILNKHYQEAHDIIHAYCDMLRTQKDNYSYRMVTMLTTAVQVETALGDFDAAARHCRDIRGITDSLHIGKSSSTMEASLNLIQSRKDVSKKNTILYVLGVILLAGLVMGATVLYYTRRLRHRNRRLMRALNGLDAYRHVAFAEQTADEQPATAPIVPIRPISPISPMSPMGPMSASESPSTDRQAIADEDERLFVKLDGQVTRDRLFLKPNFGRDDMARLIGVDKNRIGRIMSRYSDASNASVYINTKRVEYGARLLQKHPEYTIAAIAAECGMSNTVTFNRTFKEIYGITPSEYRANAARNTSTAL